MIELSSSSGSIPIADDYIGDVDTLLINLDEVPLGEVLARRDTALAAAVSRALGDNRDDHLVIAGFNNFV